MRRKRRLTRGEIKKRNKKIIFSGLSILCLLSVGYGAFQTTLNVNVTGKIKIDKECVEGKVWEFSQKDEGQEFRVPCSGEYKVELWGAQGGDADENPGGLGGYTSGKINFKINKKYYVYVGSKGKGGTELQYYSGGYNGGGNAVGQSSFVNRRWYSAGGGATDIRINNNEWNVFTSLKSRFMIAGGGSGTYKEGNCEPEAGSSGGLIGYNGTKCNYSDSAVSFGSGGSQLSSGYCTCSASSCGTSWKYVVYNKKYYGSFGLGGTSPIVCYSVGCAGAGGSGYYGGGSALHVNASGGGGSSFISGHEGCDAISEQSTEDNIIHTGQSIHYSGLYFTDTVMIDGAGYKWTDHKLEDLGLVGMPTHSGIGTMTGNEGDGFAKITLLTRKPN